MKILITWIGPWLDKGEAAMLISMVKVLRERIPNIDIVVTASSFYPQNIDIVKYGEYDLKVLPGLLSSFTPIASKLNFLKFKVLKAMITSAVFLTLMTKNILWLALYKSVCIDAGFLVGDNRDTVKEYDDADWIIFCGGEYIINVGIGLLTALYEIIFSKLLRKPVMLYAQSFGPFNKKYAMPWIKTVLNKVDIITTREGISKGYLEDIGVTAPVVETADAAFTLPSISREEAISLIERETEIPENELMVGITTIYRDFPPQKGQINETVENYLDAMAEAIDYLITKLNTYVIFFPHNKTTSLQRNDELATMKIFDKIENKSRVTILTDDYTPEQLKGMYGCMSLFIGTRYHSCIFALSMNVPTIVVGYRHKAPGISKMLGLEEYVCDINTITTHELTSKIDKMWAERDDVKKKLEKNIKVMQAKSMDNVRLAVEYLGLRETNKVND